MTKDDRRRLSNKGTSARLAIASLKRALGEFRKGKAYLRELEDMQLRLLEIHAEVVDGD